LTHYANRFLAREPAGALFNVYVQGGILTFVRVAKRDLVRIGLSHVPLLRAPLVDAWDARARRALTSRIAADDRRDPRALLARDPANFRIAAHQVESAVLDAEDLALAMPHQGVLRIDARLRKVWLLLEDAREMSAATGLLRNSLGSLLVIRAVWSPHRRRYVSERGLAMSFPARVGRR
jgi:hypothetical protein